MADPQTVPLNNNVELVAPDGTSFVGNPINAGRDIYINPPIPTIPKESPPKNLFAVPFPRDRHFVSRQKIFDQISVQIEKEEPVILYGLGGVGKSQIAIECAERFRKQQPDSYVLWLSATSIEKLLNDFDDIARRLKLVSSTLPSCTLVADWLNDEDALDKKCLMIIDNLDTLSTLDQPLEGRDSITSATGKTNLPTLRQSLLQQLTPTRRLLFTTRTQDVARSIGSADSWIRVDCLDPTESIALFKSHLAGRKDVITDEKIIQDLASELDNIPLALTQAAAFMTRNRVSASKYLTAIRSSDLKMASYLTAKLLDNRRTPGLPNSIFLTWQLSFEEITTTDASAGQLLSVLSMLAASQIPRHILCDDSTSDEALSNGSIGTLESYCLLKGNNDENDETIQVHSLVTAAVRAWLRSSGTSSSYAEKAALLIAKNFPSWDEVRYNPSTWRDKLSMLSPHATAVLRNHVIVKSSFDRCSAMLRCLIGYETYLGRYASAWEHAQLLNEAQIKFADKHHVIKLQTTSMLTNILIRRSQFSQAELIQRQALSEFKDVLKRSDHEILRSQWLLAIVLKEQDKVKEAEEICLAALFATIRYLGREDIECLKFHSLLAEIYERQGEYPKALSAQTEAYRGILNSMGQDHHMTVLNQGHIARLQKRLGNSTAAITQCREARSRMLTLEGNDHPASILCTWWLAFMLAEDQQYEEAESLYESVTQSMEPVWGSNHPDLNRCRHQQAAVKTKTFHIHVQEFHASNSVTGTELLTYEMDPSRQEHLLRKNEDKPREQRSDGQIIVAGNTNNFYVTSPSIVHASNYRGRQMR